MSCSKKIIIIFFILICACDVNNLNDSANTIVDKAISNTGGDIISNARIHFKFRDYYYIATRKNGTRSFERCTDKACCKQQDVLENNGDFYRFRESEPIALPDSMKVKYSNSINSVHYFSVLPYGLNDKAVNKELVGETIINKAPYYLIKVTFDKEGGGVDFEDQYMYWIHKENFTVDYLAYNYQVNEGGTRFRVAYNERVVKGVRIVDYENYKSKERFPDLTTLPEAYEKGDLKLLSTIELENVEVKQCPEC